ncbi:MAG TPA: hypothetical protein VF737_04970 [Gemmatimonadaceae bacterium]
MIGVLLIAQLAMVAHAADTVGACEPLDVSVAVSAPGSSLPRLVAPSFGPFDVMRSAVMPHVERDSRAVPSVTVEYRYVLVTDRVGEYTIPPFEARLGSAAARTAPLHVRVVPAPADATPTVITRARIGTLGRYDARLTAPETVYVGQQADYTVTVFLNAAVRNRLRRNPTFYPPDMQSMLAYDVPGAGSEQHAGGASSCFDALVYRRALFPLQAGRLVIPPAQLTYSLPSGASFFSHEVSHELQTDSAVIVAVDPPAAGRPAEFDGAVGRFRLETRVAAAGGRVGDPLTVTVRVTGTGNVKLLPRPHLDVPWATAVPSDERVHVDSGAAPIGGTKAFDWILTPRIAGELDVPPATYAYFDPATRRYETTRSSAASVRIAPGTLAALDTSRQEPPLAVRTFYDGQTGAPLSSHPVFWLALALVPLPALRARWRDRRRGRGIRAVTPIERVEAARTAATGPAGARMLRRAYVNALADRLGIEAEAFTTAGELRRTLRRAGVSVATAGDAEALLRALDAAAFSGAGAPAPDAGATAVALVRRIDGEALPRRELPFRFIALALMLAVGAGGTLHALQGATAADAFSGGVVAYQEHDFAGARDAFARVVAVAPRAADGWMNLGTVSWTMHDTVGAVLGWRRALGLQPLAGDARNRLGLVHGLRVSSPGYVPPIPVNALLLLMAACWLAASVAWHPSFARRRAWAHAWAGPLAGAAAVLGLGAIALGGRLAARDVAVVRTNTTLSTDPAFGADQGSTVVTGEMVRVLNQQGAWNRVRLDGGRQGWMPAMRLAPLDGSPASGLD